MSIDCVAATLAIALVAPATVDPAAEPAPTGLRAPGYYVHVSPGGFTFLTLRPFDYLGYLWGLAGGRFIPRGKRLAIAVGGFVEHVVIQAPRYEDDTDRYHFVRTGPELRVGASDERVFGYGLARLGVDTMFGQPGGFGFVQGLFTLGAGVQGAFGSARRLLLGLEPAFEISFPVPWPLARVRTFIGVRF